MLQEIKIKNFKSFKEEAELSFEAYSDDTNQLSWINSVKNLFRNYKMKAYTYIRQGEFGFTERLHSAIIPLQACLHNFPMLNLSTNLRIIIENTPS